MAPNVPTSDQPISLSSVSLSEFNMFQGLSRLLATTCKLAEPKYSTAFDKNEKTHLCRSRVCLCRLPCESRRTSCCATSFRQFPRLSANFRDFPRLSANFRQFPRLSAPFAGAVEGYPTIFRTISAKFPQILEVQCALHGRGRTAPWSLWCTVAAHQVKGVAVVL